MSLQLDLFAAPAPKPPPAPAIAATLPAEPSDPVAILAALLRTWRATTEAGRPCATLPAAAWADAEHAYAGMRARWFATPRFERPTIGPGAEVLAQLHTLDIFRVGFTATREPIVPLEILHRATGALRRLTQQPTEAP